MEPTVYMGLLSDIGLLKEGWLGRLRRGVFRVAPDPVFNAFLRVFGRYIKNPYRPTFERTKTIFVHIPKTAGTSIAIALYNDSKPAHELLREYQAYDPNRYNEYFKFTFVRNPYDRFVSGFSYLKQGGDGLYDPGWWEQFCSEVETLDDFIDNFKYNHSLYYLKRHLIFIPQVRYMRDLNGDIGLDFVGRLETIREDIERLEELTGMTIDLQHRKKSKRKELSEYMDNEKFVSFVNELYREDFEQLGYDKAQV